MQCPDCNSEKIWKNGYHRGKQRFKCFECGRQFIEFYKPLGYDHSIKEKCLEMYVNGSGFPSIERVMGVHHTTVINWVKEIGNKLEKTPPASEIPEITQIDELQTFVGKKKSDLDLDYCK